MSQTPKSRKICQITQQSEKYNITNSCLLVVVDNLKTQTDKDDFSVWLPSINSVTESVLN